ncbi:3-ketoacyl-CoA thiolase [Actinobacillus equuli]|nr:3-ketoacyl-CoA thiolase [Actinobacillus equuli]
MFAGATIASAQALDRAELQLQDMSFIDIHESSASQILANIQFLSRMNLQKIPKSNRLFGQN